VTGFTAPSGPGLSIRVATPVSQVTATLNNAQIENCTAAQHGGAVRYLVAGPQEADVSQVGQHDIGYLTTAERSPPITIACTHHGLVLRAHASVHGTRHVNDTHGSCS
jgi:hypothetical protein